MAAVLDVSGNTRVQIISQALILLGNAPIMSLDNQSDITNAANSAFDKLLASNLSKNSWRFACTITR